MPTLDFFCQLGLYVVSEFLAEEDCQALIHAIGTAPRNRAKTVQHRDNHLLEVVDDSYRSVDTADLGPAVTAELRQRLLDLMPDLQKRFGMPLEWGEASMYLAYRQGDFFKPHTDSNNYDSAVDTYMGRRRVTAILFLNRQAPEPTESCFGGGRLNFYGLLDGPQWERCAFGVDPKPGLLVAFRSDVVHEVTPVTFGERFTIATAFHAPLLPESPPS